VAPALARREQVQGQVQQIGWGLFYYALTHADFQHYDKTAKRWEFKADLLKEAVKSNHIQAAVLNGPFDRKWTLDELAKLDKGFTVDGLGRAITLNHMQQLTWMIGNLSWANQAKWLKGGKWELPKTVVEDAVKHQRQDLNLVKDAWGRAIKLVKRDKPGANPTGWPQFNDYELVSAGPDGKFGTKDDVKSSERAAWYGSQWWWLDELAEGTNVYSFTHNAMRRGDQMMQLGAGFGAGRAMKDRLADGLPRLAAPMAPMAAREVSKKADMPGKSEAKPGGGQIEPTRVREYFPETMLWQPALITDEHGRADLPVTYPDSITTWRLSASASSRGGLLGGVSAPLRVFQDFFVDLDLPVSLTQNDEVAFPVAVYNYLKEPQTVQLELQRDSWFELMDSAGPTRALDLKPNEVTSVKFRIKARKVGFHPLTVKARGTKLADAIKRGIEVVPDGVKVEKVVTDRLAGRISQTIDIPADALPDASKILVKVYPGIMSQVMEGTEGMLRLPGG
jgi:hypothetical protein